MPSYITPPVDPSDDDPFAIAADVRAYMQTKFPGLDPQAGSFLYTLSEGVGLTHADTRRGLKDVMDYVAAVLGRSMFLVPPQEAVSATAPSTWTMPDTLGYLIPAGTQVSLAAPDGSRVSFQVQSDSTVPAGQSATATGGVILVAEEPGADGNGLQSDPQPEDRLDFTPTIVVTQPSSGGEDAEEMTDYLSRFGQVRRLARRLVIPEDFEIEARTYPGVLRAVAINGYDPVAGTTGNTDVLTLVPVGTDGLPVSQTLKDLMLADMTSAMSLGGTLYIRDPTYTVIAVEYQATSYPGFDPAAVKAAADAAVLAYLDPKVFGLAPFGDQPVWYAEPVVPRAELFAVLENVQGVRHVTSLLVNGSSTADIALPGNPGLPSAASTVSGAVTGT